MMNRAVGSFLILVGTAIGAGMLALPMTSAELHFKYGSILLIGIWLLMTLTGLLVLEVNLTIDSRYHNFSSMAKATLGRWGQIIAWLCCLLLLYSLTWAYIAGNGSLISTLLSKHTHWHISKLTSEILFTLIFGGAVFWSTHTVDWLNRGLISIKGILVLITLALLLPKVNWTTLFPHTSVAHHAFLVAAPVFLTSFGYHTVIPSIRDYVGPHPKLIRQIIIWGTVLPLLIYLLWMISTLGVLPLKGSLSFHALQNQHSSVGDFILMLTQVVHTPWISAVINGFSNIAMTTSFLGVTLGLFDFIADALKRKNSRLGRSQTALLAFLPPLLLALVAPNGFIHALGYAAIFVAILEVLLPAAMAYRLRKSYTTRPYTLWGGNTLLGIIFIAGIGIIACQLMS